MITCRTNPMISNPGTGAVAEMLKKLDFIIGFGIKIDETLEFADIVLPRHTISRGTGSSRPTRRPGSRSPGRATGTTR